MRKDWDNYFIDIAKEVATRSTCDRAMVGCVLVKNRRIISTGYNGSPRGLPHCDDVGHFMVDGRCKRAVHAEANAILHAKEDLEGVTAYVTHEPCIDCSNLLSTAGIVEVVFLNDYQNYQLRPEISFKKRKINESSS